MTNRDIIARTIAKFEKSEQHKQKVWTYIQEHKPQLFKSTNKSAKIRTCGNILQFQKQNNGEAKLYSGSFCKYDRICIACATRRAIIQIQRFEKGIKDNGLENMCWYHITPTIQHNKRQSLEYVMGRLRRGKENIARTYKNSKRDSQKAKSFFSRFDGMVCSVEISYGKNGFHPHLHILACCKEPIETKRSNFMQTLSNKELQKEWYKLSNKLGKQIGIKPIGVQKNHFNRKGIGECFKYTVKNSSLKAPQLMELLELQEKKQYRFLSTYGICRKWQFEKKEDNNENLKKTFVLENAKYRVM